MALIQLLTQCRQANEAEALETLRLNPGIINDPWNGWETFMVSDGRYVWPGHSELM